MLSTNIKEETRTAHQQLEKKVILSLKSIRSEADYAGLLIKFYAYFKQVELAIAPYITPAILPDYKERRHSGYLKEDIQELGFPVDDLPLVSAPHISSTQQALGALYVLEGSIMGGSIIVQMLAKAGVTRGISFFSGYGPNTVQMWGEFTTSMDAQAITEEEEDWAIDSANETFRRFGDLFAPIKAA